MAIQVLERLEFFDQRLILVFEDCHSVFQTLDIFLLLPSTFLGRLSVNEEGFCVRILDKVLSQDSSIRRNKGRGNDIL